MKTFCGVWTWVQVTPSLEIAAVNWLPTRVSFTHRGGKVVPALGPVRNAWHLVPLDL